MTQVQSKNSIDIFHEFPEKKYIPLLPVQTFYRTSPLLKIAVNIVRISTNRDDKDIYQEKNGEWALTKKGLMKLMAAANIQIMKSQSTPPSPCRKCLEMARATKTPCQCNLCENRDDIAWEVTISVPDLTGGSRMVTASREFLCADERRKCKTDTQFQAIYAFRGAFAESKALNRALREALMLKASYKMEELSRPFAVPLVTLDMDEPDVRKAMIQRLASGKSLLYGNEEASSEHSNGDVFPEEVLCQSVISASSDDDFSAEENEIDPFVCEECGLPVVSFQDKNGNEWDPGKTIAYAQKTFGKRLCHRCLEKSITARKTA